MSEGLSRELKGAGSLGAGGGAGERTEGDGATGARPHGFVGHRGPVGRAPELTFIQNNGQHERALSGQDCHNLICTLRNTWILNNKDIKNTYPQVRSKKHTD